MAGLSEARLRILTQGQKPIEGVEVKIVAQDGTEFTTTTDANGNYKHAGLPAGRYLIEHVEQLLLDTADNESFPISINILGIDPQEAVTLVHYRLKVSLNGILSQTQSEIWQGLMKRGMDEPGDDERMRVFVKAEIEVQKAAEAGEMTEREAKTRLDALKEQLWSEDDIAESQEQTKQLAEAKLTAHTELLGPLDESASQRLKMAIKGAVQLNLEEQDKDTEKMFRNVEAELVQAVEAGKMTRKQAADALTGMQRWLWDEKGAIRRRVHNAHITRHPLYQQTIKDVLSEDAFAEYTTQQLAREGFLRHASRDIVVVSSDIQMLLDDAQREKFQLIAAQLSFPSSSERPAMDMFSQFYRQVDRGVLNQWQRGEFERLYGTIRSEMK